MMKIAWRDVEAYLQTRDDVLIPMGSTEEHGYHLPLGTDTFIAEEIAARVSEQTGILVAPPLWYGVCIHTAAYPGTINLSSQSLRSVVGSMVKGFLRHGFKTVFLLTAHAGRTQLVNIKEVMRVMVSDGIRTFVVNPYEIDISDIIESYAFHACEVETSVMLYLKPELVDMSKAAGGELKEDRFVIASPKIRYTKSGVFGRPELASKEKGMQILDRWVQEIVKFIKERIS